MSMFIVYRKKEYAVILADSLAYRHFQASTNLAPLRAPKLTHVAPCVFAAHAGVWKPACQILNSFHEYLLTSPIPRTFDEIVLYLEQEGIRRRQEYRGLWQVDLDLRIPIVLTGQYRHPEDVANEVTSTCLILETSRDFKPERVDGAIWAYDAEVTKVTLGLLKLPAIQYMLNSGPLSLAQALKAIHAFISNICVHVSSDCNIVIIGDDDEHYVIEGHMLSLPLAALRFG